MSTSQWFTLFTCQKYIWSFSQNDRQDKWCHNNLKRSSQQYKYLIFASNYSFIYFITKLERTLKRTWRVKQYNWILPVDTIYLFKFGRMLSNERHGRASSLLSKTSGQLKNCCFAKKSLKTWYFIDWNASKTTFEFKWLFYWVNQKLKN